MAQWVKLMTVKPALQIGAPLDITVGLFDLPASLLHLWKQHQTFERPGLLA